MHRGNHNVACLVCNKKGHKTSDCRLLKQVNQAQATQKKGKPQKNGKQVQVQVTCKHCGRTGHTRAECFILNPSLKNQPKGKQQQKGGGNSSKCTFCHRGGHTSDECFKANPELRGGGGSKSKPQEELRCSYCQMPDHTLERCYLLNPDLRNPYNGVPKPSDPYLDLAEARTRDNHDPPARVMRRIRVAEALAFDGAPAEVQRHSQWQRIQGWNPARQIYFTLPMYGAVVDRPVRYTNNPFNQPQTHPAYEMFDTSGDTIMCGCGFTEGYKCNFEHLVREVVEQDGLYRFSDRSEDAFGRIMSEGFVNRAAMFEIY